MRWRKGTFIMTAAVAGVGILGGAGGNDPPFSDDFESYTAGQPLTTQTNDWEPWCPAGPDGLISTNQARSGTKSYRQDSSQGSSDTVHRINATSGTWEVSAWMYHPTGDGTVGPTYWIMLNQYMDANCAGTNNWSAQINMDTGTGEMNAEGGYLGGTIHTPLSIVFNEWVQMRTIVDLDADQASIFYGDDPVVTDYQWSEGVSGGGISAIACLDLFTFGGTLYWDDVVVEEMAGGPLCMESGDWVNNSTETGTVADTCGSDNARTTARRATFAPTVANLLRYDASTTSKITDASSMTITGELSISNAAVTNVTGRLQVLNQVTNVYATIGSALLSTTDVVISGSPTGNPDNYIAGDGTIDVRVVFQQTSGGPNWEGRIDDLTADVQ